METAVGISGSPSPQSKSRRLLVQAVDRLARHSVQSRVVDLCDLPADALLGRTRNDEVDRALASVAAARILIVSTPVYRASYSGLLKCFFDLLPQAALAGKVAIPIATGGSLAHSLVVDHALRPLLASVGALVVSTAIYGTDAQFSADGVDASLAASIDRAVTEAQEVIAHGVL